MHVSSVTSPAEMYPIISVQKDTMISQAGMVSDMISVVSLVGVRVPKSSLSLHSHAAVRSALALIHSLDADPLTLKIEL